MPGTAIAPNSSGSLPYRFLFAVRERGYHAVHDTGSSARSRPVPGQAENLGTVPGHRVRSIRRVFGRSIPRPRRIPAVQALMATNHGRLDHQGNPSDYRTLTQRNHDISGHGLGPRARQAESGASPATATQHHLLRGQRKRHRPPIFFSNQCHKAIGCRS